jgi:hypothetical protein
MDAINTDITSYTIDELFSLLDISINEKSTTDNIKKLIEDRTDVYIKTFNDLGRENLVTFFESVKTELLGKKVEIEIRNDSYVPFSTLTLNTTKDDMFNNSNGSGNPIHRKTITKLLNIDSRFRPNYENTTSTNFILDLPYPINNVIEIKLCDLELPATYYPFSVQNQNNYFWFATYTSEQVISNTPNIYYYVIPEGNYYFDNLITDINKGIKLINTSDTGTDSTFAPIPISVTFNLNFNNLGGVGNGTGKLSFGIMPTSPVDLSLNVTQQIVQVDLNFNAPQLLGVTSSMRAIQTEDILKYYTTSNIPINQRVGWMLGFRHSYYTSIDKKESPQLYYISESIMNIIGPSYLYIILDDFNKSNNINFLTTSKYGMLPDNIIARISLKSSAFSIQSQNDFSVYSEPRYYYGPVNISKIHITVVDEFSRVLNLNNNDFSCTLRMTTIYSAT